MNMSINCINNENLIVTVKIKPWLKEFLQCRFGDPVLALSKNMPGVLIASLVEYTPEGYVPEKYLPDESMDVDIPRDLAFSAPRSDLGNIYLPKLNQIRFESSVSVIFKDELFYFLDDKIRYEGKHRSSNMKDCIYQFCIDNKVRYNHIQYENLKKMYYRYRQSHEIAKKRGRILSLVSPLIF